MFETIREGKDALQMKALLLLLLAFKFYSYMTFPVCP